MESLELWLVRHGQSTFNAEKRIQGQANAPLSELGIRQAKRLSERLAEHKFDHVHTSDLQRALQTAEIVCPDLPLIKDSRLREVSLGILQGTLETEHSEEQAAMLEHFRADTENHRVPEGESFTEVRERVIAWQRDLPDAGKTIVFTHGGVISTVLRTLMGQPSGWTWALNPTGITRLLFTADTITLQTLNDHAHLYGFEDLRSY